MFDRIVRWVIQDLTWGGVFVGASLAIGTMIGSLFIVGVLLVKLPATYFQEFHSRDLWADRHPLLRILARGGKNVLGAILVVLGAVLALPGVPGQGLLTILAGLMLLDIPGKRRLERRIVGRPRVLRAVNRLRRRFGSPPLVLGRRRAEVFKRTHPPARPYGTRTRNTEETT